MNPFRALGTAALVLIVPCALFLSFWPVVLAPRFAALLADFGSELPFATRLALHPATAFSGLGLLGAAVVTGAARPTLRPLVWSLAAGGGVTLVLFTVLSVYAPLLALAAAIN
jgi:hypothetical protein